MFTGLIGGVGALTARDMRAGDAHLHIATGTLPFGDAQLGESIAVNGVCLTVVDFDGDGFHADVSRETLALTTLGTLAPGRALNLERAMRPDDRLGGHLVSGHVDGVGRVLQVDDDGRAQRWTFAAPRSLLRYIAQKSSICVDGVSLTVNAVNDMPLEGVPLEGVPLKGAGFEVALVPHTIAHTAFAQVAVGDAVNLEIDLVARYVERLLAEQTGSRLSPE